MFIPPDMRGLKAGVISEDWPVWLSAMSTLGFGDVLAWAGDPNLMSKYFAGTVPGLHMFKSKKKIRGDDPDVVFVSGSPKFVHDECFHLKGRRVWATVPAKRGRRLGILSKTDLRWQLIAHAEVGGVTNGLYWLGTSMDMDFDIDRDPNFRVIQDVLSVAEDGVPLDKYYDVKVARGSLPKVEWRDDLLLENSLLPVDQWNAFVATMSVFTSTRWIKRRLTKKELAIAFDLPAHLHKKFDVSFGEPPFLSTTPGKVVMAGATAIAASLKGIRPSGANSESKPDFCELPAPLPALDLFKEGSRVKAARPDDAKAEVEEWNDELLKEIPMWNGLDRGALTRVCDKLRGKALRFWNNNLRKEAISYLDETHGPEWRTSKNPSTELRLDREAISDALRRASQATYWEWKAGSTLFFWRWHPDFRQRARDGVPVYFKPSLLPSNQRPQPTPKDEEKISKVKEKLSLVRDRGYIEPGFVINLTGYFDVPKAQQLDIRMVYDATKSGLNAAVWAPNFFIPSPDSLFSVMDQTSWMADIDLGEFFLNFPLDMRIRPYVGVDLTPYFGQDSKRVWERWGRCMMGFRSSPYNTALSFGWAEELIRGNPGDSTNPYQWDHVELNLPGSSLYQSSKPWVSKRRLDGSISAEILAYVDDLRVLATGRRLTRDAMRRAAAISNYLGVQDAPRKRRFPDRFPGAWAGTMAFTTDDGVYGTCSQERWNKTRQIIQRLTSIAQNQGGRCLHKQLMSDRGFLVYMARAFPAMRPYLKGIHLTIDSWRPGRDSDGWKDPDWFGDVEMESQDGAPEYVFGVSRLAMDLEALSILFEQDKPAIRVIRPSQLVAVKYGFGDASGSGFGTSVTHDGGVSFRVGVWGHDADGESSNYRELRNLVESVEAEAEAGHLLNTELFLFTDNSTAEAVFYRGTSSNRKLFNLVLRLRRIEMACGLVLHVIHCAGTRMQAQGSDGLSRGNLTEGVMSGKGFLDYIPIHKSAFERSKDLERCFRGLFPGRKVEVLEPKDWFERGHDIKSWYRDSNLEKTRGLWFPNLEPGTFVWHPAPAAAKTAVEELRKARLKRQESTHIFVCPRLMTPHWKKQLGKVTDCLFEIPVNSVPEWDSSQHEPLVVGIVFPFIRSDPWQLKGCPKFRAVDRQLQRLWKEDPASARTVLYELSVYARALSALSPSVVCELLQTEDPRLFLPSGTPRCRRTRVDKRRGREQVQGSEGRRPPHHGFSM